MVHQRISNSLNLSKKSKCWDQYSGAPVFYTSQTGMRMCFISKQQANCSLTRTKLKATQRVAELQRISDMAAKDVREIKKSLNKLVHSIPYLIESVA